MFLYFSDFRKNFTVNSHYASLSPINNTDGVPYFAGIDPVSKYFHICLMTAALSEYLIFNQFFCIDVNVQSVRIKKCSHSSAFFRLLQPILSLNLLIPLQPKFCC